MSTIDTLATLATVRRRNLDCEGVPMLLALRGARPAPDGDPRRTEGRRLARLLASVHRELVERPELRGGATPSRAVEGTLETSASSTEQGGGDEDDTDATVAVSHDERVVAEAVSVVAETVVAGIVNGTTVPLDRTDSGDEPAGLGQRPLRDVVQALEEGRWLTVVNYHNTPASAAEILARDIAAYGRHYAPVTVPSLAELFAHGTWSGERPPIIPVFYEGYRNNYEYAAAACETAGLVAWFFLITDFLNTPPPGQVDFARTHNIGLAEEELQRDRIAMTWAEAAELSEHHVVTSHTATHSPAHRLRRPEDFDAEIVEPTLQVERVTGQQSPAHAWLYGSGLGVSPEHDIALHRAGYRWCFGNLAIDDVPSWALSRADEEDAR